jgi:hypothetical protein
MTTFLTAARALPAIKALQDHITAARADFMPQSSIHGRFFNP